MKFYAEIAKQLRDLRNPESTSNAKNIAFEDKVCEIMRKELKITAKTYEEACEDRKTKAVIDETDGAHEIDLNDMFGDLMDGMTNKEAV